MNINLTLSPQKLAELERLASDARVELPDFVSGLVDEALESEEPEKSPSQLDYEEWHARFRRWVDSHQSRNPNVDDSRESIYD